MSSIKEITDRFDFKVNKCQYCNNIRILDTDNGKFVIKNNDSNNNELFKYLQTKNFHNFLNLYNYDEKYEVYPYIDEIKLNDEEKAIYIIYLISILHNKTTFYKEVDLDLIKEIYEDIQKKLRYLMNYYDNLVLVAEDKTYPSPSFYLLLRNSSVIFKCIDDSKYFIDKWYNTIKNKKTFRVTTIHNNLELEHLLKGDDSYLISWNKSTKASPIYDLLSFYKSVHNKVEFSSLFEIYNSKYPLTKEELYLLFSLMLVPTKLEFDNSEIINTKEVYELTNYLMKTIQMTSKYNPEKTYEQTN